MVLPDSVSVLCCPDNHSLQ